MFQNEVKHVVLMPSSTNLDINKELINTPNTVKVHTPKHIHIDTMQFYFIHIQICELQRQ